MDNLSRRTLVCLVTRRVVSPSNARGAVLCVSKPYLDYGASRRIVARLTACGLRRAITAGNGSQRFAVLARIGSRYALRRAKVRRYWRGVTLSRRALVRASLAHASRAHGFTGKKKIPRTPSRGRCARYSREVLRVTRGDTASRRSRCKPCQACRSKARWTRLRCTPSRCIPSRCARVR